MSFQNKVAIPHYDLNFVDYPLGLRILPLVRRKQRMESVWSQLSGAYSLWDHWSKDEKAHRVYEVLRVRETLGNSYT